MYTRVKSFGAELGSFQSVPEFPNEDQIGVLIGPSRALLAETRRDCTGSTEKNSPVLRQI